ncbi:MAG: dicarboxylate/amino acid:cation symporter [Lachnospiraceae bacterium]|nr:dicarboxylate/amino acid:cation symporter [Lachnospiraceae bacterium]
MGNMITTVKTSHGDYLTEAMTFINEAMVKMNVGKTLKVRAELLAEEIIAGFVNHGTEEMEIDIAVKKRLGDVCIDISAPGREVDTGRIKQAGSLNQNEKDTEKAIRAIILKAHGEKLKYSYRNGINRASIAAGKAERSSLVLTMYALILGIFIGLIAKFLFPGWLADGMCKYFLDPVKTMFMNALKIIVGPVVFFSIVTCISQFKNLSELGRMGAKVMGMYLLTTIIAAVLALTLSTLLHPGAWGAGLDAASQVVNIDTNADTSLLTTIINIVPDNFIKPFLESDTLQLIFLAVICGIAVGAVGSYSEKLSGLFEGLNELFLAVTTMFSRCIPLAAFCSVVIMLIQLGTDTILSLLGMCGTFLLGIVCMIMIYGILVMVVARLNPVTFFRKIREGMLTSFALSSSSAAMPVSMNICTEKLGVSQKLSSFSIPLGATVNMDGATINLIIVSLFLARMYAVPVSGSLLVSMMITVIMLSLGAPGVPGAGLVCLGIVLEHIGVPIEAVGLIMAINPFLDMFTTMNNVTGDLAATTIVAKSEGMLDKEMFDSK